MEKRKILLVSAVFLAFLGGLIWLIGYVGSTQEAGDGANIGAGILQLGGLALGCVGLALTAVSLIVIGIGRRHETASGA